LSTAIGVVEASTEEVGGVEDVDHTIVVEVALLPGRQQARVKLAEGQEVARVEDVD
jgi:hypothetical protein